MKKVRHRPTVMHQRIQQSCSLVIITHQTHARLTQPNLPISIIVISISTHFFSLYSYSRRVNIAIGNMSFGLMSFCLICRSVYWVSVYPKLWWLLARLGAMYSILGKSEKLCLGLGWNILGRSEIWRLEIWWLGWGRYTVCTVKYRTSEKW